MSIEYIREYYGVPAKIGGRVEYTGDTEPRLGTIEGSHGPHLLIRLDGEMEAGAYHPTWKLRYLEGDTTNTASLQSAKPPKVSRSKQRYLRYLDVGDCFDNFKHFLDYETTKAREARGI